MIALAIKRFVRASCVVTGILLGTTAVHAQQFQIGFAPNPTGSGAQALGMGNAFIAYANDATAASWNPAGLLRMEAIELSLALNMAHINARLDGGRSHGEMRSRTELTLADLNYFSVILPMAWEREGREIAAGGVRMALSLNYLQQYQFDLKHDFDYTVVGVLPLDWHHRAHQDGGFSSLSPSFAIELTPRIAMGLTVNIWNDDLTQSSSFCMDEVTTGTIAGAPMAPVHQRNRYTVTDGYSIVLGGMFLLPGDKWNVGIVYKPGFTLNIHHEVTGGGAPEERTARLTMPTVVGLGLMYNPSEQWFLTTDVTWTDWSAFEIKERDPGTGHKQSKNPLTGRPSSAGTLADTYTVRCGAEYRHFLCDARAAAVSFVPIRVGAAYDPVPAVGGGDDVYTVSFGSGLKKGNWRFDAAYEYRFGNSIYAFDVPGGEVQNHLRRHRVMVSMAYQF